MVAIDTNVLVYSFRRDSRFHQPAITLMRNFATGSDSWAIPWQCIFEFVAVVTNRRIWRDSVTTPTEAAEQIDLWLTAPTNHVLSEPPGFERIFLDFLRDERIRGPVVHDARIAAICVANGVDTLITADRDFHLFPQLRIRNPFI